MAQILKETKSNAGSPYVYYSIDATSSNRTANTIDIKISITGRLGSPGSYIGKGGNYGIYGYITLENVEYRMLLKETDETWEGTTKHTTTETFTLENLEPSQNLLTGIKFRAIRTSGNTSNAGYLKTTNCSDLEIPTGHTPPSNVTYTMSEINPKLIESEIPNDVFVENLSIKSFNINALFYEGATPQKYTIYNRVTPYSTSNLPLIINFGEVELFKDLTDTSKIPIRARVLDNIEGVGFSNTFLYDYIPYKKITLIETSTNVKRNGQTTGKVNLNVKGNFFNGIVGNKDQSNYKPIIKYKFWRFGEEEPIDYDYQVPSNNIIIDEENFNVNSYEIGNNDELAINFFDPDYAYRIKIKVEDNFTSYESQEKSIAVGEATWTEYRDRIDFKRITIKGNEVESIYYKDGDKYILSDSLINVGGCLTSSKTQIRFGIFTAKSLKNITSITVNYCHASVRYQGGGYLIDDREITSGLTAQPEGENAVYLVYEQSAAFSGTNNTPVAVQIHDLDLTFNE